MPPAKQFLDEQTEMTKERDMMRDRVRKQNQGVGMMRAKSDDVCGSSTLTRGHQGMGRVGGSAE